MTGPLPKFLATAYFQTEYGHRFFEYTGGGAFTKTRLPDFWVEAPSERAAAEKVYAALNADDRPNGKTERSLSVGDVVTLCHGGPEGDELSLWAVEGVGFREVTGIRSLGLLGAALERAEGRA